MAVTNRTISINTHQLDYIHRRRRGQRTMALSVHSDGRVTVTTPKWVSLWEIEHFLIGRADWLLQATKDLPQYSHETLAQRRVHYKKHREEARKLVTSRLRELNTVYGFSYRRISIRSNTSRWGSCSEHGNLNFDYRLLFLAPHLRDYILIHELCHLQEMNHGPGFWKLVERSAPLYKQHRKELAGIERERW